jgi:hypothetical protein
MKTAITILLLLTTLCAAAQNAPLIPAASKGFIAHDQSKDERRIKVKEADTSKENKEPRYFYLTGSTNVFVNTIGSFARRFSPSLEFGRTYGIFDIGVAAGRLNSLSSGGDTSMFIEARPTINIFSKGRFAEGLCLGAGYVFSAQQGFMTEICNSINFNISETVAVAVSQGYYFFDGVNSNRSTQYMGLNLTYNFLKNHSVNKQRKKEALIKDN